jgi:glycosyltransferase involved in cell wall biosynthesis
VTRVLALWQQLAGHTAACFHALAAEDVTLRVLYREATPDAPFDDEALMRGLDVRSWVDEVDDARVAAELDEFQPDVLLVCSWNVGAYRRQLKHWEGRALRIVFMDNPWLATPKQWAGRLGRKVIIDPTFDAAFVSGERQATFARHLGIGADRLLWGVNSCGPEFFTGARETAPEAFLFVGRLAEEKGLVTLAEAYRAYRAAVSDPWPLRIAGTGPEGERLASIEGVELLGFLDPADVPAAMAAAGCLVLPSTFEPWGVVVHEAVASGLPVVCTDACGASTRLVLDGYNGRVVPARDAAALTRGLRWVSEATVDERAAMSRASVGLAAQYTPERWASYFVQRCDELLPAVVS